MRRNGDRSPLTLSAIPWNGRTASNTQANARKLHAFDVYPRGFGVGCCVNAILGDEIHDALLERGHKRTYADLGASYVDKRVDHQDPGAVIRHLAPTVDLHDIDVRRY